MSLRLTTAHESLSQIAPHRGAVNHRGAVKVNSRGPAPRGFASGAPPPVARKIMLALGRGAGGTSMKNENLSQVAGLKSPPMIECVCERQAVPAPLRGAILILIPPGAALHSQSLAELAPGY